MLTLHHAGIRYVFAASTGKAMLLQQLTEPRDLYINQSIFFIFFFFSPQFCNAMTWQGERVQSTAKPEKLLWKL
jgi:hypothetical protein